MEKKIISWFDKKHLHPRKIIKVGINRFGLTQPQVEAAIEHCYQKIVISNKNIADIDIARYIFNVAKDIDCKEYEKEMDLLKNYKDNIYKMKELMYGSWIVLGLVNLLFWFFILNWK